MIFGAVPALPGVLQTTATKVALATVNDPKATAVQKQAALQVLQATAPTPPPTPGLPSTGFLAENKTALLAGGGALILAGVGYWLYKSRRRR